MKKLLQLWSKFAKAFQEGFNKIKANREGKLEQIFYEDGSVANQEAVDQIRETLEEITKEKVTDEDVNEIFPEGIPTKDGKVDIEAIKQIINDILAPEEEVSQEQHKKSSPQKENISNEKVPTNKIESVADELLKLNDLKEKGILTEEEFAEQKHKLLKQ